MKVAAQDGKDMNSTDLVKAGHYITFYFTSPCSFGDHYDAECTCGWKVKDYATGTSIADHVLEVLTELKVQRSADWVDYFGSIVCGNITCNQSFTTRKAYNAHKCS